MKNTKKMLAMIMSLTMIAALTACNDDSSSEDDTPSDETTTTAAVATTTAKTVEVNTETLKAEEEVVLDNVAAQLPEVVLENGEVKWLAHYDLNPSAEIGASKSVQLELFEKKYGGSIKYYPTTWDTRYNDLSTYILGGEGVDIFPVGDLPLPKGIVSGMFQPVDDYIDINDTTWANVKKSMDLFNFGGKHYSLVTAAAAENVCLYNKDTIDANGLDDPWDLLTAGEWNWDTFKDMLLEFVDPDAEQYGLDGYFNEKALMLSAGVPIVGVNDGHVVCNINDPTLEAAMNYQYELYSNGLVLDTEPYGWAIQPQFMGEGKELFYIIGSWDILKAPDTWATEMTPENLGVVPVPSPAGSDNFTSLKPDGYVICKDAGNPQGAALFAECGIIANFDEESKAIGRRKMTEEFGLSEEFLLNLDQVNQYALDFPVVEFAAGASTDIAGITVEGGGNVGTRAPFHGVDWATEKERIGKVLDQLITELDGQIAEVQAQG